MLVRPLVTNLKMTVRTACAVSSCSPFPQPTEALAHWLSGLGVVGSQPLDRRPLPLLPLVAGIKIKQAFFSTNLASLMAFEQRAAGSHFWLQNQLLNWSKWYKFFCICSPRKDMTGAPSRSYIFLLSSKLLWHRKANGVKVCIFYNIIIYHLFYNIIGFLNKCPLELDIPFWNCIQYHCVI